MSDSLFNRHPVDWETLLYSFEIHESSRVRVLGHANTHFVKVLVKVYASRRSFQLDFLCSLPELILFKNVQLFC